MAQPSTASYPRLDVIAVGAHPDDVEIACGGTLAQLAAQGYQVGIVDLTDGEPTPGSPSPEVRLAEAQQAARTLGVARRETLSLPNRRLFDTFEARVALATEFRKYRPRIVLGFGGKTPMASPDHEQAVHITDAAVFYCRLTKWDECFEGFPPHVISAQLYFRFGFELAVPAGLQNQFTMDIGDTLETKLDAVRCYHTQFQPDPSAIVERIRGAATLAGSVAGFAAGEMFMGARPLGTKDLVRFVLD